MSEIDFEFDLPEHLMLNKKDEKDLRRNWPRLKSWMKIFIYGMLIGFSIILLKLIWLYFK